jgi:hypothetical protein
MLKNKQVSITQLSGTSCSENQYWVRPHQRKRIHKNGETYIENVKGYCCHYHNHYREMAIEENISLDHLYYALTVYGEASGENSTSKRAIAWVIRNRFNKKSGQSYKDIVLRKSQFDCWEKSDPNYKRLQKPGKHDEIDKIAWIECKTIIEEIHNAPEKENPVPNVFNYFSGNPKNKKIPWEKNYFDLPNIPRFHFVKLKQ